MLKLKSKFRDLLKSAASDLEPLWVSGLALVCVLFGSLLWGNVLRLSGERYEWAIYLTLGTVFPALLLILSLPKYASRFAPDTLRKIKLVLALLLLIVSILFIFRQRQYTALAVSAVHTLLLLAFRKKLDLPTTRASILVSVFVIILAWTISASLLWWDSLGAWFFSGNTATETIYRFLICGLALVLVFVNLHGRAKSEERARPRIWAIENVAAILIIGAASVRSDQLFNTMSYSHWSAIVGPAEMVRQSGWLLWDVPSPYGFLNVLAVALFPVESVWQSNYIINSLLLFASAIFLFFVLRSYKDGLLNFCFALFVTLAGVFLMAGWPPALLGPQTFPSLGPFRFVWCYALLLILILEFRSNSNEERWQLPLIGCVVWLVGTLWSSESAVYCAAIWLPSYALMVYRKAHAARAEQKSGKSRLRTVASWAILPPLLLVTAVGLITLYYILKLGHSPDWRAFYEHSLSYAGGFLAIPIDVRGPVWTIFLIFCALSIAAAYLLRDGLTHRAASLITGTWGALWAVTSYFVSRSHPNNATALTPMLCLAIGVTLHLLATRRPIDWWARVIKMSFVPVLTILLTVTFGNASFLGLYLSSPELGYVRNIDTHLPLIDPSLRELLSTAQVKPEDPLVYSGVRISAIDPPADGISQEHGILLPAWPIEGEKQVLSSYRAWLPTAPFVVFASLSEERKQLYMERFISRVRSGGWLIQSRRELPYTSSPWFYNQLSRTHAPTKFFENADWQVIWFDYKSPAPER